MRNFTPLSGPSLRESFFPCQRHRLPEGVCAVCGERLQWESEIDEFIRWSERYDLYCKMRFFGDAIKRANDTGEKSSKRGPSNMLMQLPDEFTYQQVIDLRVARGMDKKGTSRMLGNWKERHYIKVKDSNSVPQKFSSSVFIKLKFRKENS